MGRASEPGFDYGRPVQQVARDLLGHELVSRIDGLTVVIRLTEVEAYAGYAADPGSHAQRGPTVRNSSMFGPPGHAYVFRSYGLHWMLNLVCEPVGRAAAVLLRAGEVVRGADLARQRRGLPTRRPDHDLARGPANLAQALGVTAAQDGAELRGGGWLQLRTGHPVPDDQVDTGPRIGLGHDDGRLWRLWIRADPTVSRPRTGPVSRSQ